MGYNEDLILFDSEVTVTGKKDGALSPKWQLHFSRVIVASVCQEDVNSGQTLVTHENCGYKYDKRTGALANDTDINHPIKGKKHSMLFSLNPSLNIKFDSCCLT